LNMRAIALALLLCACAEAPGPPPAMNPYAGTRWVMTTGGADAPTIEFADSRASGNAGCNRWFAQVSADASAVQFTSIGATRRMCNPSVMEIERLFLAALERTATGRLDSDVLVLQDESGAELARFTRDR
jgi:heat shock protein HslJ